MSTASQWRPLSAFAYGFAISPFLPEADVIKKMPAPCIASLCGHHGAKSGIAPRELESHEARHIGTRQREEASESVGDVGDADDCTSAALPSRSPSSSHASTDIRDHFVALDVGDDVYVFEEYGDGQSWVRGYVVSTASTGGLDSRTHPASGNNVAIPRPMEFSSKGHLPRHSQQVPRLYIGVFPRTHVHIREHLECAEMKAIDSLDQNHDEEHNSSTASTQPAVKSALPMETLVEVDESLPATPRAAQHPSSSSMAPVSSTPLPARPSPPLPTLKQNDETLSGAKEPLCDEIACGMREWYQLLFVHLAHGDYGIFAQIQQLIASLQSGRKQLQSGALSIEEARKVRRECVACLAEGSSAQGLQVIVRHPDDGDLAVGVHHCSTISPASNVTSHPSKWTGVAPLYAQQVALAYTPPSPSMGEAFTMRSLLMQAPATGVFDLSLTPPKGSLCATDDEPPSRLDSSVKTRHDAKYFHVLLEFRALVAGPSIPGETLELTFYLYNKADGRSLSEEFCVILDHHGMPIAGNDVVGESSSTEVLFTEISALDINELHIVCRAVRKGRMRMSPTAGAAVLAEEPSITTKVNGLEAPPGHAGFRHSRMTPDHQFRRPFACGAIALGDDHEFSRGTATAATSASTTVQHAMPLFAPNSEANFSTLHEDIMASKTHRFHRCSRLESVSLNCKLFYGRTDTVLRECAARKSGTAIAARLGFPDAVVPGSHRNDAYIKLWSGNFNSATHSSRLTTTPPARSIQVSVEVRNRDGSVIEDAICRGAGQARVTQFDSLVFYHQNSPTWGELLKIHLQDQSVEDCHLFFSFRSRSSKEERTRGLPQNAASLAATEADAPFAHAYLPLFRDSNAFLSDGTHTLLLWRKAQPSQHISPELYFALPPTVPGNGPFDLSTISSSLTALLQPLRDSLTVRSFLVSTVYTQSKVLLTILQWDDAITRDIDELKSALLELRFVGEVEIVKYLADIFDALLAILVDSRNDDNQLDDTVFDVMVTVLGIVQDRRFVNFSTILDLYIENHCRAQTAHTRILASMQRLLQDPGAETTAQALRSSIKVWPYLFRLIVKSRENQRTASSLATGLSVGGDAVSDHFETMFRHELEALLRAINHLMTATKPSSIIGTQALALQNFAAILPELAKVYDTNELASLEAAFADSIFVTKGKMVVWKLLHLVHVTKGFLLEQPSARSLLIPSIVRWVRPHLGYYVPDVPRSESSPAHAGIDDADRVTWMECARLAITVLAIVLDRVQQRLEQRSNSIETQPSREESDNLDYILSALPRILETFLDVCSDDMSAALRRYRGPSTVASTKPVLFPSSYPFPLIAQLDGLKHSKQPSHSKLEMEFLNCGAVEIAAVLTLLILLSPTKHLIGFLDEQLDLEGSDSLSKTLLNLTQVTTLILRNVAYPSNWLNVTILGHQMALKIADAIATWALGAGLRFGDAKASETTLWRDFFEMLLTLLSSEHLVIENFTPHRRRAVWRLAGDLRGEGAVLLAKFWSINVKHDDTTGQASSVIILHSSLNPGVTDHMLELCFSHHDELSETAVQILGTMITHEWQQGGTFGIVEGAIIDKLDMLLARGEGVDRTSGASFIARLKRRLGNGDLEAQLKDDAFALLASVERFLQLLENVQSLPSEEGFRDEMIAGTLKLLGFLHQANRIDAFSSHALDLVDLHLSTDNFIEAALTLKLHADLYSWDVGRFADSLPRLALPRQSHFARKETLYMLVLDYLGKGQAWEIAIDVCRELASQYEYHVIDYTRLSEVLTYQASLFRKITTIPRSFPPYYRVAYYGNGWPVSLRQAMFVYRGRESELFPSFCQRFQQRHPRAAIVKVHDMTGSDLQEDGSLYLQITQLQPEPDLEDDVLWKSDASSMIRCYYEHNAVKVFSFARSLASPDSNAVVADVEKTFLRCEDAFPTVLCRSEVAEIRTVRVSALETALDNVYSATDALRVLARRYTALHQLYTSRDGEVSTSGLDVTELTMALDAAVDAPSDQPSAALYREVFFAPSGGQVGEGLLATSEPSHNPKHLEQLENALNEHALAVHACLCLHAKLCSPEMWAFHTALETSFEVTFAVEAAALKLACPVSDAAQDSDGQQRDHGMERPSVPTQYSTQSTLRSHITRLAENAAHSDPLPYSSVAGSCDQDLINSRSEADKTARLTRTAVAVQRGTSLSSRVGTERSGSAAARKEAVSPANGSMGSGDSPSSSRRLSRLLSGGWRGIGKR